MEETGFTVRSYSNPRIYDVFVREELKNFMVHHVMALYDVEMNESAPQVTTSEAVSDGANDSLGYIWMDIQKITEENASPLVLKVKSELLGFPELDKTSYMNWKVNDETIHMLKLYSGFVQRFDAAVDRHRKVGEIALQLPDAGA